MSFRAGEIPKKTDRGDPYRGVRTAPGVFAGLRHMTVKHSYSFKQDLGRGRPSCTCAHAWHREQVAFPAVYRCRCCDGRLWRGTHDPNDVSEYSVMCDCGNGGWCEWPKCVAVPRGRGKRVTDTMRKLIWTMTGQAIAHMFRSGD
jgi:hypothetical protein